MKKDLNELSTISRSLNSETFGSGPPPSGVQPLYESEERSSILAETAPAMIWSAGPDKLCDYFNRSWLDYRGRTLDQEVGEGWFEGVHPEDLERCLKARHSKLDRQQSLQIEYRLRRHDNVYHWVLDTAASWLWPPGVFRGYVGSCIEIHQRKLTEENLRDANASLCCQNKELSEFAYAASHDLQEPLRTLAHYTQLLAKRYEAQSGGESAELFPVILGSVRRMQGLIRDLLDYSQIVHRSELRLIDLDCNMLLDQVLFVCQAAIQDSGVVVTSDPLPVVRADEAQLAQVLQNLISNAIKYRQPDKRAHVHVSAAGQPDEWLFQVTDNGIGFDPQYSERIFGLFKRLHGIGEYSGSRIGLAICRKIIERHGGRIWAEAEAGHGARFFFTLRPG
jgi:PAS domain S-box-containing protein